MGMFRLRRVGLLLLLLLLGVRRAVLVSRGLVARVLMRVRFTAVVKGLRILLLSMGARFLLVRRGLLWVDVVVGRGCRTMILRWFRGGSGLE
jgi:hypothetical protein